MSFIKYIHLHIECPRVVNVDSSQRQACKWRKCLKMDVLDVEECKGCKEDRKQMVEFEMPEGMKELYKNPKIK